MCGPTVYAPQSGLTDGMPREVVLQHACHRVVLRSQKPEDFKEAKLRQIINEKQQPEGYYLSSAVHATKVDLQVCHKNGIKLMPQA